MQALVFTAPNTLELREEPDPQANDGIVLRVSACGICGSDMHAYHGHDMVRRPPPLILGHEVTGTIETGPRAGERVAVNPLIACGACDLCLAGREHLCAERVLISMKGFPGGFADKVRVPERNLVAVPDGLSDRLAALTEPMAVAYHAVNLAERAAHRPISALSAAVVGGGAIGLCTAHVLESRGVRAIHIAEPAANRRAAIARAGRFRAWDPTATSATAAPADGRVDLVFDAFGGRASRETACRLVHSGGVVVHIGLASGAEGVDVRRITLQEVSFLGAYCYTMVDFRETLVGLAAGRFGAIDWIEERPLADGVAAFRDLDAGRADAAKIVLRM